MRFEIVLKRNKGYIRHGKHTKIGEGVVPFSGKRDIDQLMMIVIVTEIKN